MSSHSGIFVPAGTEQQRGVNWQAGCGATPLPALIASSTARRRWRFVALLLGRTPLFHLPLDERADEGPECQLGEVEEALLAFGVERQQGPLSPNSKVRATVVSGRPVSPSLVKAPVKPLSAGQTNVLVDRFRFALLYQRRREQRVIARRDRILRARARGDDELVADEPAHDRRERTAGRAASTLPSSAIMGWASVPKSRCMFPIGTTDQAAKDQEQQRHEGCQRDRERAVAIGAAPAD